MIREHFSEIVFQMLDSAQAYNNSVDYHMHNCYELYILLKGDVNLYIKDSCYHITSSSLAIINNLEPHKFTNNKESNFSRIYFHIPETLITRYSDGETDLSECFNGRAAGQNNILLLSRLQQDYILDIFYKLEYIKNGAVYGKKLLLESYIIQLLVYVNTLYREKAFLTPDRYSEEIRHITEYIETHLSEKLSLDRLASTFSWNKYYLSHKFKKETATTIGKYITMARVSLAKQLLAQGMNVTETCLNSGFRDYSNFITVFRKVTGYTPGEYQKLL